MDASPMTHLVLWKCVTRLTETQRAIFEQWVRIAAGEGRMISYRAMSPADVAYWHLILTQVQEESP